MEMDWMANTGPCHLRACSQKRYSSLRCHHYHSIRHLYQSFPSIAQEILPVSI